MKDILEDIETRMFALDRALPDNSAARDLLEILHRSQVEIGRLREGLKAAVGFFEEATDYEATHPFEYDRPLKARAALPVAAPTPEGSENG